MSKKILWMFIMFVSLLSIIAPGPDRNWAGVRYCEGGQMSENPFGVLEFLHWNHSWNNHKYATHEDLEKAVRLMREAGVGIVRMDFLWQDIEPQPGEFHFEKYDFIVDLLRDNDIGILGILDYTSDWASPQGKWNYPAKNDRKFIDYARKVVGRYQDKVKYWEIWNEPDSHTYWEPQDGLVAYCALPAYF
ncbi:MAG: cellulase family glycosylhydrolase [Candidatus Omnitrophica bacterium]|nr:cellulase family glycosylhydrolase [Candidatus Omnitrophota bacterium]